MRLTEAEKARWYLRAYENLPTNTTVTPEDVDAILTWCLPLVGDEVAPDLRIVVANTLRQLAGWGDDARSIPHLIELADEVERHDLTMCCPMCQEIGCDAGCPLETVRAGATTQPDPEPLPPAPWRCRRCGSGRWVGWRAGPAHLGWPQRAAQCVRCGDVQDLPAQETKS